MEDLKEDDDYIYREGNWQNGIRIAVAVSVSGNTSGSSNIRTMITIASILKNAKASLVLEQSFIC